MNERGQSLVELAISFVMLMFLLSGAVEFGILFFQNIQLRDAIQEGALIGSVLPYDTAEIESRVRNSSNSPLDLTNDAVSILVTTKDSQGNVVDSSLACVMGTIEVRAMYEHKIWMPFLSRLIGRDTIQLDTMIVHTILMPECG